MPDTSHALGLPYLQPSQAQKHVTMNEALARLDLLVQTAVTAIGTTTPPGLPGEGETHVLGSGASGAWAGHDGDLACWRDGAWVFVAPRPGWRVFDLSGAALRIWDGTAWILPPVPLEDLDGIGIGTNADATNRLAVAAHASLFTHAGADHRLTVNKAATDDTASLLYQSGWTGHAEIGLTGSDELALKVSPDGSAWTEALRFDPFTGRMTGAAMQQSVTDTGAGRAMIVGAFGLGATGSPPVASDINDTTLAAGLWRVNSDASGTLPEAGSWIVHVDRFSTEMVQSAYRVGSSVRAWRRNYFGGVWTPWRRDYHTGNILGPVAQSGGVPTGGIIERGSNANGQYVRFADGTQICTRHFGTAASTHAWVFPAAFSGHTGGALTLMAMPRASTVPSIVTENFDLSATAATFKVWDKDGAALSSQLYATAIGRWF